MRYCQRTIIFLLSLFLLSVNALKGGSDKDRFPGKDSVHVVLILKNPSPDAKEAQLKRLYTKVSDALPVLKYQLYYLDEDKNKTPLDVLPGAQTVFKAAKRGNRMVIYERPGKGGLKSAIKVPLKSKKSGGVLVVATPLVKGFELNKTIDLSEDKIPSGTMLIDNPDIKPIIVRFNKSEHVVKPKSELIVPIPGAKKLYRGEFEILKSSGGETAYRRSMRFYKQNAYVVLVEKEYDDYTVRFVDI